MRRMVSRWAWQWGKFWGHWQQRKGRPHQRPFQLLPSGSCPLTFPNKRPEKSSEPECFINRFLTDFLFPCQPSLELPGGWPGRAEIISLVPEATATRMPCHSAVLGFPAGLPSLPSATVHGPGPSAYSCSRPRSVHSRCTAPRLLPMISLQLSLQESSRLLVGGRARCWLWQQVNKMCSQLGVSSWPGTGHRGKRQ